MQAPFSSNEQQVREIGGNPMTPRLIRDASLSLPTVRCQWLKLGPDDLQFRTTFAPKQLDDYMWIKSRLQALDQTLLSTATASAYSILARMAGEPVGGIIFADRLGWTHIDILWVEPEHRRKGIGSRLLDIAEQNAREMAQLGLRLSTTTGHNALRLYQQRGYTIDARYPLRTVHAEHLEALLLSKRCS